MHIVNSLTDHKKTKSHSRHISYEECQRLGLNVSKLEDNNSFQDLVLTVHHAYMQTFASSSAIKIIENHLGIAMIQHQQQQAQQFIPLPQGMQALTANFPVQMEVEETDD